MELWTQKYMPKHFDDLIGNQNKLQTIEDWIKNFHQPKAKKILLLSGPPGIGKTLTAHLILEKYNYKVVEYNASSIRGPKNIKEIFSNILGYNSIVDIFKKTPTGVIMDEIDTLCYGGDKGGMGEFLNIIKKKKKKDGSFDINNPIICTYNQFTDKKLTDLKNLSIEVKMNKPTNNDLEIILDNIINSEKLKIDIFAKQMLIKHSMGDIRRMINIIYDIYISYGKEMNITMDILENVINIFMKKNIDPQIFDSTYNIFNSQDKTLRELIEYYDADKLLFPMMVHENYIGCIYNRNIEDKFPIILECIDALIDNDIYQTKMYENQNWSMLDNAAILFCGKINKIAKIDKPITIMDKINYTTLLNKISLYHTNKKLINSLNNKLGINLSLDELYFLSELISYHLFNKNGKKEKVLELLKQHNLKVDDVDLLLKINKFSNNDPKKKYTTKIKKNLSNN